MNMRGLSATAIAVMSFASLTRMDAPLAEPAPLLFYASQPGHPTLDEGDGGGKSVRQRAR